MFKHIIIDCLSSNIEGVTYTKVFNGYALFKDHVLFGVFNQETLYLKPHPDLLKLLKEITPFTFTPKGSKREYKTGYIKVPTSIIEDTNIIKPLIENIVQCK